MKGLIQKALRQCAALYKKGALHIFLGSFATKFFAFFGSIFLVRILTKAEYGLLSYMENLYHYAFLLAGMGLTNALFRYVILADTPTLKRSYYDYVIRKSTIFNVILTLVFCGVFLFYPHKADFAQAKYLLPVLMLSLPFNSLLDSNTGMLRAMFNNKGYAIAACTATVLCIALKFLLALFFKIEGAVFAQLTAYTLCAVFLLFYIRRLYFTDVPKEPLRDRAKQKEVRNYSLQYMLTNGIWALFMLNDVFLLSQLTGDAVLVADYKVAYVFPGNLSLISSSIGIFVSPYFVRHENDLSWIRRNYKKTYLLTFGLVACAVAVLFLLAEPIITLIYGASYASVVPTMRLLLIAALINNGLRYTNANLLSAMGKVKYNMVISIGGMLAQVGLNLWAIPRFGATGVACTSIAVYACMAAALFVVFHQQYFSRRAQSSLPEKTEK